jgi:hypothetical protein
MLDHHQTIGPRGGQRQEHGMTLAEEQPAAGTEQVTDHLGPLSDVRQPAERPDAGEDEVVAARAKHGGCVVDVGNVEVDLGARARRQLPGDRDGSGGEVQAGHPRSQPAERDRVGADVALEMDPAESRDVPEPGQVEAHHI